MSVATERFERVWHSYVALLSKNPDASFTPYARESHVNVRSMQNWMIKQGLSVHNAKKVARACQVEEMLKSQPKVTTEEEGAVIFAPVSVPKATPDPLEMLFGLSVTLPDGAVVSIKQGSAHAIVSFIKEYQRKEGGVCLD